MEEQQDHPARHALVELINIHCDALEFEPIHRILTGVDPKDVLHSFAAAVKSARESDSCDLVLLTPDDELRFASDGHPLFALQPFLDAYVAAHPGAEIDYIHGEDALRNLSSRPDAVGFMPRAFAKSELFAYVREHGALPRKTFSMGEATDKRYYLEARRITR